jgi:hypothetical protein
MITYLARRTSSYSNAGGKPWHSVARSVSERIRSASSERDAAIC